MLFKIDVYYLKIIVFNKKINLTTQMIKHSKSTTLISNNKNSA